MNKNIIIRKAVFPILELGARFSLATKSDTSERLPLVDGRLIRHAVEEAVASGITEMIFVTGRNKRSIENGFGGPNEWEREFEAHQKYQLLELLRAIKPDDVQFSYVRQPEAHGVGQAMLSAEPLLGKQAFAVIIANDFLSSAVPVMKQMIAAFQQTGNSILCVESILPGRGRSSVVVDGVGNAENLINLHTISGRSATVDALFVKGMVGRYVLTPSIFQYLRKLGAGAEREIKLTEAIALMLQDETVLAYQFDGKHNDGASLHQQYNEAMEYASKRPPLNDGFRDLIREIIFDDGTELATLPPHVRQPKWLVGQTEY